MEILGAAPPTARAQEIARRREELLGLLRDLPESEYELSLTDLVETGPAGDTAVIEDTAAVGPEEVVLGQRKAHKAAARERKNMRRNNSCSSSGSSSGSSVRSSRGGVLLNFYVPASLARSLTAPRPSGRGPGRRAATATTDSNKRFWLPAVFGCWPAQWDWRWGKSRRRAPERTKPT